MIYYHPSFHKTIHHWLLRQFFNNTSLNKDFKHSKYPIEKMKYKWYFSDIKNFKNKNKEFKEKRSLTEKWQDAMELSEKTTYLINYFIDYIEKVKNILLWKNEGKSQLAILIVLLVVIALFIVSIE